MATNSPTDGNRGGRNLADRIGRKEQRKIRGREQRRRSPWFWAGMFGLVGWSVGVPTVIGLYLGIKLDQWRPGQISWTLTGLLLGLMLGCLNAWFWVSKEHEAINQQRHHQEDRHDR